MLFQAPEIEGDLLRAPFWFLSIGATIGLPIVLGGVSAARSSWVSFELGASIGMCVALAGTLSHLAFIRVADRLITHHDDYWQVDILAFTSLVLVLVIQVALTVRLCRLIDRRQHRSGGIRRC